MVLEVKPLVHSPCLLQGPEDGDARVEFRGEAGRPCKDKAQIVGSHKERKPSKTTASKPKGF